MSLLSRWRNSTRPRLTIDGLLACVAIGAAATAAMAMLSARSSRKPVAYQPGEQFALPPGLNVSRSPATIVIFLNTNCGACQRSAEVFQRIARTPRPFQLVVLGYEAEDVLKQFLEAFAIPADAVLSVPIESTWFTAVPKLVLLDRGGSVHSVWAGSQQIANSETTILASARGALEPKAR